MKTDSKDSIKNKIDNFLLSDESDGFYLLFGLEDFEGDQKFSRQKFLTTLKRF